MRTRRAVPPCVGLDLSLVAPAACRIPSGWEIGDWGALDVMAWEPPPVPEVVPGAPPDHDALYCRLSWIARRVVEFCLPLSVAAGIEPRPVVAIENYGFSRKSSSVTKLAELGGAVRVALWDQGIVARPITASAGRKLLLGRVPVKGQKARAQAALWAAGCPKVWSGDILDAFVCANTLLSDQGAPALTLA